MRVLRAMRAGGDELPEVGDTARTLGVRTQGRRVDVEVSASGLVYPEDGGMSVSPPPPENLPEHRRPERFGGIGKDPVWELETDDLPRELVYLPDPNNPDGHGYIAPYLVMRVDEYRSALRGTRDLWGLF